MYIYKYFYIYSEDNIAHIKQKKRRNKNTSKVAP